MRLRVMTWNIHACVGTDSRYDPGRIADVIREQQPDVVALRRSTGAPRTTTGSTSSPSSHENSI